MATARNYSNTASQAQLSAAIAAGDTSITLTNFTGYPAAPFTAAIARGTANEEIVLVTAVSSSTVTVTRGYDGTTAKAQGAGSTFQEVAVAADFRDANAHVVATTGVHGITGAVVGTTDVQTLTNKTLTSPSSSNPTATGTSTIATAQVTTLNVSGASTLAGTSTTSLTVSGASTLTGALTANGGVSTTTLSTSGAASLNSMLLTQRTNPANPPAGSNSVWIDSTSTVHIMDSSGSGTRTLPVYLGSGTAFPASPNSGEVYYRSDLYATFRCNPSGQWQQLGTAQASTGTRTGITTANIPLGYRYFETDTGRDWVYTSSGWVDRTVPVSLLARAERASNAGAVTYSTTAVAVDFSSANAGTGSLTFTLTQPTRVLFRVRAKVGSNTNGGVVRLWVYCASGSVAPALTPANAVGLYDKAVVSSALQETVDFSTDELLAAGTYTMALGLQTPLTGQTSTLYYEANTAGGTYPPFSSTVFEALAIGAN